MTAEAKIPVDHPLTPLPVAVVVGASSGIGSALALRLAKEGYKVALLARRKEKLDQICHQINQSVGDQLAIAYPHDVTDFQSIPGLFQEILQDFQRIDVLAYVSGIMYTVGMSEYNFKKDLATIQVDLLGGMAWLGQGAVLFERMGKGHLVGVSSVAGDRGRVANPPYHAAKAGLSTYLESLRNRLTRKGVHVLTVNPGYVETDLIAGAKTPFPPSTPEKVAEAIYKGIRRRKQVLYTPWWWRWIILVVQHIPSFIFRRMSF